jgi:hypothetical protein
MNWKWGGNMANARCFYIVEGECEEKLINALKMPPNLVIPGKIKKWNIITTELRNSILIGIPQGSYVVLVFDTDVPETEVLKKNIAILKKYCARVQVVCLAQVRNFEDEIVRCTDVKSAPELTKSTGTQNFKKAFCKLKDQDCRRLLERHSIDVGKFWTTKVPEDFSFLKCESEKIKLK